MTRPGPDFFALPHVLDQPILDGVSLSAVDGPIERQPSTGVNFIQMYNGAVTLQIDYRDADRPTCRDYYQWPLRVQAYHEDDWYLLERHAARKLPVYWVDFIPLVVVYPAAAAGATAFKLDRRTAKAVIGASFPAAAYPTRAYISAAASGGVSGTRTAQTVIESGTPTSGQVLVSDTTVTTPALTAGDVLEVHYIAAYHAVVRMLGVSRVDTNLTVGDFLIAEARARDAGGA